MLLKYYLEQLNYSNRPDYINKYLNSPSLKRLKNIGYFCGMDYASKDIYNFKEKITRYDHSITTSLIVNKLTNDKIMTIAGLFHDIATPCFSHVIDYMNKDYEKQETTEQYTEDIIRNDLYLQKCLIEDNINIDDIINFKKYSVLDNDRPKLCADRLDGVILTGMSWTKEITKKDITNILNDICIYNNLENEEEIGFKTFNIAKRVLDVSDNIDIFCHSKEDNYMMNLLAKITKIAIEKGYITYNFLYIYDENMLFNILKEKQDDILNKYLLEFQTIKKDEIKEIKLPKIKSRTLNPLVNGNRIKD